MHVELTCAVLALTALGSLALAAAPAATTPATQPADGPIVFIGDSLTDGFTWPMLMRQALAEAGKRVPDFVNAAAGGWTAADCRKHFDSHVLRYKPTMGIILIGGNDAAHGRTVKAFTADVEDMIRRLRGGGAKVVLVAGSLPGPRHWRRGRSGRDRLSEAVIRLAKKHDCILADSREYMRKAWDVGIWLWESDHGHLNVNGCRVIARAVLDALGYKDVLLPETMKVELLPGLVRTWRIKALDKKAPPLDEKAVDSLKADASWKTLTLPESEPQSGWWYDQVRREGYALSLEALAGKAQRYVGIATVKADRAGTKYLNTGAHLLRVWVNGKKVYQSTGWTGFHAGKERVPVQVKAGANRIVIETGSQFALTLTDTLLW